MGSLVALFVMPNNNLGWDFYQIMISFLFLLGFLSTIFIPESPRFLLTSGQPRKALESVQKLKPNANQHVCLKPLDTESENRGSLKSLSRDTEFVKKLTVILVFHSMIKLGKGGIGLLFLETLQNPNAQNCVFVSGNNYVGKHCEQLKAKDYILEYFMALSHFISALLTKPSADIFGRKVSLAIFGCVTAVCFFLFLFCKPDIVQAGLSLSCRSVLGK